MERQVQILSSPTLYAEFITLVADVLTTTSVNGVNRTFTCILATMQGSTGTESSSSDEEPGHDKFILNHDEFCPIGLMLNVPRGIQQQQDTITPELIDEYNIDMPVVVEVEEQDASADIHDKDSKIPVLMIHQMIQMSIQERRSFHKIQSCQNQNGTREQDQKHGRITS
ncbi:hypothetical protein LOTGIDRAFT_161070 [Lottia gigantea]|uniref:Uncharacterized protein n=1 Tax=Lottia gigantea TaxID=225164 RepID=V4C069_LOTGI|nr:hypothetical protein LOTGIDRAFT_161070 [Lottia gigantea]ESO94819.1 hypothetical protein LOTGIDRAFT_161070 [Lottia gigantea]